MIKRKIIETVEEYNDRGDIVKKVVTETEETDDSVIVTNTTTSPYVPFPYYGGVDWRNLICKEEGCAE